MTARSSTLANRSGEASVDHHVNAVKQPRRILSVVGARPNFIKLAPLSRALATRPDVEHRVVHTGQHYDPTMSDAFFAGFELPAPHYNLEVGSASHAEQTARVMLRLEPVCLAEHPDLVLVYGDVNSTLAAALVAAKQGIAVGHVEAGLRSGDWTMPEEVNRVLTDRVSAYLFAPSRDAVENLCREGIPEERVSFVGNIMIDSLVTALGAARSLGAPARYAVAPGRYVVVTLHRPATVDDPAVLREIWRALSEVGQDRVILFPVHPRTRARIVALDLAADGAGEGAGGVRLIDPLPYLEMLSLLDAAGLVITDSGGLQEETTFLGVPCLTLRSSTERPITCLQGTNRLVAARCEAIVAAARARAGESRGDPPLLERWDGRTAERIVQVLCDGARF